MRNLALIVLSLMTAGLATAAKASPLKAPRKHGKIVITFSLSQHKIWVDKYTRKGSVRISGTALPIVAESMHTGRFHPTQYHNHFRTVNGNVYLENLVFFDGSHAIRTTRLFAKLLKDGRPVTGQVTLESDFGQIVYKTVDDFGVAQTEIRIRK